MLFLVCGVLAAAMFVGCTLGDLFRWGRGSLLVFCGWVALLLGVYIGLLVR
jgi:hypothetical protein